MYRKMPCFWSEPKSTRMSSTMDSEESLWTSMLEAKEVITQPSSASAGTADAITAKLSPNTSSASQAAILFMGSPYIAKSI